RNEILDKFCDLQITGRLQHHDTYNNWQEEPEGSFIYRQGDTVINLRLGLISRGNQEASVLQTIIPKDIINNSAEYLHLFGSQPLPVNTSPLGNKGDGVRYHYNGHFQGEARQFRIDYNTTTQETIIWQKIDGQWCYFQLLEDSPSPLLKEYGLWTTTGEPPQGYLITSSQAVEWAAKDLYRVEINKSPGDTLSVGKIFRGRDEVVNNEKLTSLFPFCAPHEIVFTKDSTGNISDIYLLRRNLHFTKDQKNQRWKVAEGDFQGFYLMNVDQRLPLEFGDAAKEVAIPLEKDDPLTATKEVRWLLTPAFINKAGKADLSNANTLPLLTISRQDTICSAGTSQSQARVGALRGSASAMLYGAYLACNNKNYEEGAAFLERALSAPIGGETFRAAETAIDLIRSLPDSSPSALLFKMRSELIFHKLLTTHNNQHVFEEKSWQQYFDQTKKMVDVYHKYVQSFEKLDSTRWIRHQSLIPQSLRLSSDEERQCRQIIQESMDFLIDRLPDNTTESAESALQELSTIEMPLIPDQPTPLQVFATSVEFDKDDWRYNKLEDIAKIRTPDGVLAHFADYWQQITKEKINHHDWRIQNMQRHISALENSCTDEDKKLALNNCQRFFLALAKKTSEDPSQRSELKPSLAARTAISVKQKFRFRQIPAIIAVALQGLFSADKWAPQIVSEDVAAIFTHKKAQQRKNIAFFLSHFKTDRWDYEPSDEISTENLFKDLKDSEKHTETYLALSEKQVQTLHHRLPEIWDIIKNADEPMNHQIITGLKEACEAEGINEDDKKALLGALALLENLAALPKEKREKLDFPENCKELPPNFFVKVCRYQQSQKSFIDKIRLFAATLLPPKHVVTSIMNYLSYLMQRMGEQHISLMGISPDMAEEQMIEHLENTYGITTPNPSNPQPPQEDFIAKVRQQIADTNSPLSVEERRAWQKMLEKYEEKKEKGEDVPEIRDLESFMLSFAEDSLSPVALRREAEVAKNIVSLEQQVAKTTTTEAESITIQKAPPVPDSVKTEFITPHYQAAAAKPASRKADATTIAALFPAEGPPMEQHENKLLHDGLHEAAKEFDTQADHDPGSIARDKLNSFQQAVNTKYEQLSQEAQQSYDNLIEAVETTPAIRKTIKNKSLVHQSEFLEEIIAAYVAGKLPDEMSKDVEHFLITSTAQQQMAKARKKIQELKPGQLSDKAWHDQSVLINDMLCQGLNTERYDDFDDDLRRAFLSIEYRSAIILRPQQVEAIQQIVNEPNRLTLLATGMGKSTTVMPEVMHLINTRKGKFSVVLETEELASISRQVLDRSTRQTFQRASHNFSFNINTPLTPTYLAEEYQRLLQAKASGGYIVTTLESLAALQDTIINCLADNAAKVEPEGLEAIQQYKANSYLRKMWDFFHADDTCYVADEVDAVANIDRMVNIRRGDPRPTDNTVRQATDTIMRILLDPSNKMSSLLYKNQQSTLSREKTIEILEGTARELYNSKDPFTTGQQAWQELKGHFTSEEEFVDYLTKKTNPPETLEWDKDNTTLKYLVAAKHLLEKTLPEALSNNKAGIDYGLSEEDGLSIVPMRDGEPIPQTRFSDEYEIVVYHYLYYASKSPSKEFFSSQWRSIEDEICRGSEHFLGTWKNKFTDSFKEELEKCSTPQERLDVIYTHLREPKNWLQRLDLLKRKVLRDYVKISSEQVICNVQQALLGCQIGGLSGTINPYPLPFTSGEAFQDDGSAENKVATGQLLLRLNAMLDKGLATEVGTYEDEKEFDNIVALAQQTDTKAIINLGAALEGVPSRQVVADLRDSMGENKRQILFVENKRTMMWNPEDSAPQPYDPSQLHDNRMAYYSLADSRGTDFILPPGIGHLLNGPTTTEEQLVQGIGRLRQFGKGQKVQIWNPQSYNKALQEEYGLESNPTYATVITAKRKATQHGQALRNLKARNLEIKSAVLGELQRVFFSAPRENIADISPEKALEALREDRKFIDIFGKEFIRRREVDFEGDFYPSQEVETIPYLEQCYDNEKRRAITLKLLLQAVPTVLKQTAPKDNEALESTYSLAEAALQKKAAELEECLTVLERHENSQDHVIKEAIKNFFKNPLSFESEEPTSKIFLQLQQKSPAPDSATSAERKLVYQKIVQFWGILYDVFSEIEAASSETAGTAETAKPESPSRLSQAHHRLSELSKTNGLIDAQKRKFASQKDKHRQHLMESTPSPVSTSENGGQEQEMQLQEEQAQEQAQEQQQVRMTLQGVDDEEIDWEMWHTKINTKNADAPEKLRGLIDNPEAKGKSFLSPASLFQEALSQEQLQGIFGEECLSRVAFSPNYCKIHNMLSLRANTLDRIAILQPEPKGDTPSMWYLLDDVDQDRFPDTRKASDYNNRQKEAKEKRKYVSWIDYKLEDDDTSWSSAHIRLNAENNERPFYTSKKVKTEHDKPLFSIELEGAEFYDQLVRVKVMLGFINFNSTEETAALERWLPSLGEPQQEQLKAFLASRYNVDAIEQLESWKTSTMASTIKKAAVNKS
ncbi:MAG: DEAD/DEAH box helicase family protein, partial [Chlamydiota bacterium]